MKQALALYEKIKELESSIEHQKETLKSWTDLIISKESYAKGIAVDLYKVKKLKRSLKKLLNEIIETL